MGVPVGGGADTGGTVVGVGVGVFGGGTVGVDCIDVGVAIGGQDGIKEDEPQATPESQAARQKTRKTSARN